MFRDRQEAGRRLAKRLEVYRGRKPLVLGIPRGAVVMAAEIAKELGGEVDVALVHKLRAPGQPEFAIGSIDERGTVYLSDAAERLGLSRDDIAEESRFQLRSLQRRRAQYTSVRPPIPPAGRVVIVVDDGLATGATMIAALGALRDQKPAKLIAATAVAPAETVARVRALADDVVCLETPSIFHAVGEFFEDFSQVEDEDVIHILARYGQNDATT